MHINTLAINAVGTQRTSFHRDEVSLLQLVSGNRVRAILRDVLEDEPALVDVTRLGRDNRVLRRLARDRAEEGHLAWQRLGKQASVEEMNH